MLKSMFRGLFAGRGARASSPLGRAVGLLDQGRLEEAEAIIRELCIAHPDESEARHLLGHVLSRRGRLPAAIAELEQASALAPGSAAVQYSLGRAYLAQSALHDALAALRRATEIAPSWAPAWVAAADALAAMDSVDAAEDHYCRSLELVYEDLKAFNPKIVCAHLSAYGRTGPRADWPGFDYPMQAEAGYFSLTGEPDTPPTRFGLSIVDLMTGLGLADALLAALTSARATGVGRDIDVSLFDIALSNTLYLATWYLNEGVVTSRLPRSAHPALTPCQLYRTRNGWIYLMCNKEKFWPALCEKIGKPEWGDDERFRFFADRLKNRDAVTKLLDGELEKRTTAEWLDTFAGAVPAAPINDLKQALENPFVTDHGRLQTIQHATRGAYRMLAPPVRCEDEEPPARGAPDLGEHTESLLRELGYDAERIGALKTAKIV